MSNVKGNQVVWFDMPVKDLDRAIKFYSAVLGGAMEKMSYGESAIAILPHTDETVGGCLYKGEDNEPSAKGPLLYLNCQGRLDEAIGKVESNGGKVLEPKHQIGPYGFRAVALDSEGNRVALHSR